MFLIRREPNLGTPALFPTFGTLRQEMDRLFDDWAGTGSPVARFEGDAFNPRLDVVESEKELKVTAELPGLEQKDVEVELMGDRLTLKGKKTEEKEEKGDNWYRRERSYGTFERVIGLPWEANGTEMKADATFKNGVLTVTVAKPKEVKERSKKLEIKVA